VPIFLEWDARGPRSILGFSDVVSVCRVRGPARRVEARWRPPPGRWGAGALLAFQSRTDFTVGLVDGAGVRVHRLSAGRWTRLPAVVPPAPAPGAAWRLVAFRNGTEVGLVVNGGRVGTWQLPGEVLGLAVDDSRIVFTDLEWMVGR
jgi:hypothetical protein